MRALVLAPAHVPLMAAAPEMSLVRCCPPFERLSSLTAARMLRGRGVPEATAPQRPQRPKLAPMFHRAAPAHYRLRSVSGGRSARPAEASWVRLGEAALHGAPPSREDPRKFCTPDEAFGLQGFYVGGSSGRRGPSPSAPLAAGLRAISSTISPADSAAAPPAAAIDPGLRRSRQRPRRAWTWRPSRCR